MIGSDYIYLIIAIVCFLAGSIIGIIVLINRLSIKSNKSKAEILLDEIFSEIEEKIKNNIYEHVINLDIDAFNLDDKAKEYTNIESSIVDYGFNQISYIVKRIIEGKFPDKKGLYEIVSSFVTEDRINNYLYKLLEDENIKDALTNIYNTVLGPDIERIEKEDKELNEEFSKYEQEPLKDETQEQHNQSIEDFAKAHFQEKMDELNKVYDEVEQENPNVVPVRDLRDLTPFMEDEDIIPPSDEESDTITDDGTIEVVEYLDDNINDKNIEEIEE